MHAVAYAARDTLASVDIPLQHAVLRDTPYEISHHRIAPQVQDLVTHYYSSHIITPLPPQVQDLVASRILHDASGWFHAASTDAWGSGPWGCGGGSGGKGCSVTIEPQGCLVLTSLSADLYRMLGITGAASSGSKGVNCVSLFCGDTARDFHMPGITGTAKDMGLVRDYFCHSSLLLEYLEYIVQGSSSMSACIYGSTPRPSGRGES